MSGECQTKNVNNYDKEDEEKPIIALDEGLSSFFAIFRNYLQKYKTPATKILKFITTTYQVISPC